MCSQTDVIRCAEGCKQGCYLQKGDTILSHGRTWLCYMPIYLEAADYRTPLSFTLLEFPFKNTLPTYMCLQVQLEQTMETPKYYGCAKMHYGLILKCLLLHNKVLLNCAQLQLSHVQRNSNLTSPPSLSICLVFVFTASLQFFFCGLIKGPLINIVYKLRMLH